MPQHPTDVLVLQQSPRQIRFLHPGYPDEHAVLLVLPALDSSDGIHHGLALDSCAIVADNRWYGYLTLDREGARRVPTSDMYSSLDANTYYFHVPGDNGDDPKPLCFCIATNTWGDYPIVPTFAEWRIPHNSLPERWHREPTFHANNARRCRLSNAVSAPESAHVIPQNHADEKWFNENGMAVYGLIHSSTNTIRFRVDVHQYFDRKPKFAIVPKYNEFVAHVFNSQSSEAREVIELYHNVPVALDEQSSEFLLARLAWTIFYFLRRS